MRRNVIRTLLEFLIVYVSRVKCLEYDFFSCTSLSDSTGAIECTLSFLYSSDNVRPTCNTEDNNLSISFGILLDKKSLFNLSFVCTSDSSLFVAEMRFRDKIPKVEYTETRTRRIAENFSDTESYKYHLEILFPEDPLFGLMHGDFVQYSLVTKKDPTLELLISVEVFGTRVSTPCRTYDLLGYAPINAIEEIATVPCVNLQSDSSDSVKLFYNKELLEVDNVKVFYDPYKGFLINTSYFELDNEQDSFDCQGTHCDIYHFWIIDREFAPQSKEIYLFDWKYDKILPHDDDDEGNGVTLSCSKVAREVDMMVVQFPGDPEPTINITYNKYSSGDGIKRYFASAHIPYLTEDERRNVTGWMDPLFNDTLFMKCTNYLPTVQWQIYYDSEPPLYYSMEYNAFVCEGLSTLTSIEQPYIRHWACNNVFQCQIVLSVCLREIKNDERDRCLTYCNIPKGEIQYNCMQSLQSNAVPCHDIGIRTRQFSDVTCDAVRPAKMGVVQCLSREFVIHRVYFEGFDGKMYVEKGELVPALNATLKLTSVYANTKEFYTRGRFQFICEAHSFFFEHGIKWFFRYANGTVLPPPNECTEYSQDFQDNSNPKSNATFCFDDLEMVQIICSAPVLNSNRWENMSLDIEIFHSSVPTISSGESVFHLVNRKDAQSITCQSEGFPKADIVWERFNEEIKPPLRILEGTILVFPYYDVDFLGDYCCRTKNVAGNDSKIFKVEKLELEPENYNFNYVYYGIGVLVAAIFISAGLVYRYLKRSEKRKRDYAMKTIRDMIDGTGDEDEDAVHDLQCVDPILLPFKGNYEIKKDTFKIDRNALLGRGHFAEVYKGTMDEVKGPVAFKTVKPNCPLEHFRVLGSELKILMYIGSHDNLVTLLGAYKQELDKGILYVAVEFCGLGSMDTYLRTNKHLFEKCPILTSRKRIRMEIGSTNDSNPQPLNVVQKTDTFSLHSMRTLLKWSTQIACGMEYLGTKHIIHSDLATRNVLLTAEANAKITDFGLSRHLYNDTEYNKKGDEPTPWEWMPPESIRSKVFSTKSDVWSYGITLWEIFTLGDSPYPGVMALTADFIEELENGMRNRKPKYATDELFQVMQDCWNYNPDERPTFSTLKSSLESFFPNPQITMDIKVVTVTPNEDEPSQTVNIFPVHVCTLPSGYTRISEMP